MSGIGDSELVGDATFVGVESGSPPQATAAMASTDTSTSDGRVCTPLSLCPGSGDQRLSIPTCFRRAGLTLNTPLMLIVVLSHDRLSLRVQFSRLISLSLKIDHRLR